MSSCHWAICTKPSRSGLPKPRPFPDSNSSTRSKANRWAPEARSSRPWHRATGNEVLILNGDTLFDADIEALVAAHRQRGAALSMALKPMEHFDRYGTVTTDGEGRVTAFHEKRFCTQGTINGGVYILQTHNSLFDGMPARFSFEAEILEKQVGKGNLFGFPDNGYFIDIGIPSDYAKAETDFKNMFDGTTR
ncbi:MAG: sugar phosphate nucleotidyltransferase [Alistipes indistinctus]